MRYTAEQLQFLKEAWKRMMLPDLTQAFNEKFGMTKTPAQILSTLKNHKYRNGRSGGKAVRPRILTPEQHAFVAEHYPHMTRTEVTAALNEKFGLSLKRSQVVGYVKNHGIRSGRTARFKPGHTTWNAGTKGLVKPNRGCFQPGASPRNRMPVGSTTITADGYHKTKVGEPNKWEFTHRLLWIEAHGSIPEDHAVVFADGDSDNLSLNNLECIHKGEVALRNKTGYSSVPSELRPIAKNVVRLRMRAAQATRDFKEAQQ